MNQKTRLPFLGTYFDSHFVFRLIGGLQIAAWVILGLYALEFILNITIFVLQIARGFMFGLGPTDYASQVTFYLKQPLAGILFFFVLQAAAQALLILLEIEANTRGAKTR